MPSAAASGWAWSWPSCAVPGPLAHESLRHQLHPALGTVALLVAHDLGMHRAGVGTARRLQVHLGDQRNRLVRLRVDERGDSRPRGGHVGVGPQHLELLLERGVDPLVIDPHARQRVGAHGRPMLHRHVSGPVEEDVDDDALGRSDDDIVGELLVLDVPTVTAHQLHARARHRDLERARVRSVGQVEANDLSQPCAQRQVGLSVDEHDLAEPAHGHMGRLRAAEGSHLPVLEQEIVDGEGELAIDGRPVVGVCRLYQHGAVETHLLAVVLPDVRVVPVDAGIGERDARGVALARTDRRLSLVRAVVAVVEPQAVPVDRGLHVALVFDLDGDLRAFGDPQHRAGNRAVVGEHPHDVIADPLGNGGDPKRVLVAVRQLHLLGHACLRQAGDIRREVIVGAGHRCSWSSGGGRAGSADAASRNASMRAARYSASSLTHPSSAEPRVCCQDSPRK